MTTYLFLPLCSFLFISSFCLLASKQSQQSYFSHVQAAHQDGKLVLKFIIRNFHNNAFWFPVEIMNVMRWQKCQCINVQLHLYTVQINETTALMSLKQLCFHFQVSALIVKLSACQFQIQSTSSEAISAEQIILVFNSAGPPCHRRGIKLKQVSSLNF